MNINLNKNKKMEYGILKVGDKVKYTDEAKKELPTVFKDITKHKVKTIKWISKNQQNCDFVDGDSCDIYWLELVKDSKAT